MYWKSWSSSRTFLKTVRNVGQVGKEYRKFRMGNYVGVYRVQEEEKRVIILRIFHGSQNYARYL